MRIGVPRERARGERRVAAIPDVAKIYVEWGFEVAIEPGAGRTSGYPDALYTEVGAVVSGDAISADLVLRVGPPEPAELRTMNEGAIVAGFLDPFLSPDIVQAALDRKLTALAMEAIPRTTLAQPMDALSSQANIAGYAAVLLGATATPRLLPMMVTAAGTIPPSRVLVLGVGVAGLQAIATARRLGAVVHAYDIRTETREQVESLGAKFVEAVTTGSDEGGYAVEVSTDTQAQQHAALEPFVAAADLIVTTAQIPGRRAPLLVTEKMVRSMRPGSVIVDMAAATGGNVAKSLADGVVEVDGVTIHGPIDLASRYPADASRMYSRNLLALLQRMRNIESGELGVDLDDEIVGVCAVTAGGVARHPKTVELLGVTT